MEIINFGLADYSKILSLQTSLFRNLVEDKKNGKQGREFLLAGEHYPVITLGRRAKTSNILLSEEELEKRGIRVYNIGRGGDVTYHSPGQLIFYPIIDLERHHLGVKDYVSLLENSIIELLASFGIKGEKIEGATGVWLGKNTPKERKICAIGIKCSYFCTMHGLSLNISNDLSEFSCINPCGFTDKPVTSLFQELSDSTPTFSAVLSLLSDIIQSKLI